MRSHRRAWRYIAWEYFLSFGVAFLFFFFLFFINQILVMAEQIFSRKVPILEIGRLLLYSLPLVVTFSFPFGSLVGALMAVGRLSSDNELLAFGSLGVPPRQLVAPLLALGFAFSLVSFVVNDYFMPLGTIKLSETYRRILSTNPSLELDPYSVKRYEGATIITGPVDGPRIGDIVILDKTSDGTWRLIMARSARLEQAADQDTVTLALDHVFMQVSYPKDANNRFDYTTADTLAYSLKINNAGPAGSISGPTPSTMSSRDVWKQIVARAGPQAVAARQNAEKTASLALDLSAGLRAAEHSVATGNAVAGTQRTAVAALWRDYAAEKGRSMVDQGLQSYRVEFHRRFSMPVGCLVFAFFAFPVGLRARRSGRTVGFGVGLFVAIVYWGLLVAGQTFGVRMSLSPGFSMWLPDAAVLAAGVGLFVFGRRR